MINKIVYILHDESYQRNEFGLNFTSATITEIRSGADWLDFVIYCKQSRRFRQMFFNIEEINKTLFFSEDDVNDRIEENKKEFELWYEKSLVH